MVKKKIQNVEYLVFGAGQIAGFIKGYYNDVIVSSADITKKDEVEKDIKKYDPKIVINTAAMTSLEWCEQNKLQAFNINSLGALNVWEVCQIHDVFMCHFSSGCIFSSKNPKQIYKETDTPTPESYYSWTKVWSENLLGKDKNLLIIRPRVVISTKVDLRNTLCKWLVYSHFITDQNSVTIVEDMLPVLEKMLKSKLYGTYHLANKGTISPYEAAKLLKKKINPEMKISKTTLKEVNRNLISKRVSTILTTKLLESKGYRLPNVNESISKIIDQLKINLDELGGLSALSKNRKEAVEKFNLSGKKPTTFVGIN